MKLTVNTPEGTRDRLFAECMGRRQVQERLIPSLPPAGLSGGVHPGDGVLRPVCPLGQCHPPGTNGTGVRPKWEALRHAAGFAPPPSPGWRPPKLRGPAPAPAAVLRPDRVPRRAGPQRRQPGDRPVRGGAHRSRRDESGSGDGGHSSGRLCGLCGASSGSMWSWATPASSGTVAARMEHGRRGRWSGCACPDRGQKLRRPAAICCAPYPGEARQRGPACASPGCSAGPEVLDEAEAPGTGRRRRWTYLRSPVRGTVARRDTARMVRFDLGMVPPDRLLHWRSSSGAMWREQAMRCSPADATTRWWRHSAGRPRPPALPWMWTLMACLPCPRLPIRAGQAAGPLRPRLAWPGRWRRWTACRRGPVSSPPAARWNASCSLATGEGRQDCAGL